MKFANVRELKNKTSAILSKAEKEPVVITSRGKPRAIITGISEDDFEDYLLEQSPALQDALQEAAREYARKGGITLEDYLTSRKRRRG